MSDIFADAEAYEQATARYSRQFGRQFVPFVAARRDARWLDAGCGTGALTQAIIDLAWAGEVVAIDSSEPYLEFCRRTVHGVRFERASILQLPFEGGYFDAVVSGLVLHHLANPGAAVEEMTRVTAHGGQVGVYVWDESARQNRGYGHAAEATGAPPLADTLHGLGTAEALAALLSGAGLGSIQSTRLEATVEYASFDEWWEAIMRRRGPQYQHYTSLDPEWQRRVLDRARADAGSGPFKETAAAWAVKGRR